MFQDLVDRGLVKGKRYPEKGLTVYKYSGKVFYDALWNVDPLLLEARGMVLDDDGNIVIWPFTKVFNHHENGTECSPERMVDVIRKVNGFMAAVTVYKGELLVSTTGTLDSDYAVLAREVITHNLNIEAFDKDFTYIFEICDPSDPHIVEEEPGAYLIGMRKTDPLGRMFGHLVSEWFLDNEALLLEAKRPERRHMLFGTLLEEMKDYRHEGFMIRDALTNETLMKIKSPYYLAKKFLMRMGQKKVDLMWKDTTTFLQTIDEEFYGIVHWLTTNYSAENWGSLGDQDRRTVIEQFFKGE